MDLGETNLCVANTNSSLVLPKTNSGAGYFGASGRYERYRETARDYVVLLKTLGDTAGA